MAGKALKGASLTVARGNFLVILGENAAGKSTLLKLVPGILKPGGGRLTVLGEDTRRSTPASMAGNIGSCHRILTITCSRIR